MDKILPVWKDVNGNVQYNLPHQLQDLSEAEKLLISPYLVYVPLHHMAKGQIGCKGHVCCFQQDVASISNILPRLPSDVSLVRVVKKFKEDTGEISSKIFTVRRKKVIEALHWLKTYSVVFEDIDIDVDRLSWMCHNDEAPLPAVQETTQILDTIQNAEHSQDTGPSLSQVHEVTTKEFDHSEVIGTFQTNTTGATMSDNNLNINESLNSAFKAK
jgi:hypothetical protein